MPDLGAAAAPRRSAPFDMVLPLPALLLASAALLALGRYVTDDTFIHCVFARNLATRGEFAFNPGAPVYGDTSPLWVGLLALAGRAGIDFLVAAKLLSAAAGLSLVWLAVRWARALGLPASGAAAAGVAVAADASVARWSASGMETSLGAALAIAALVVAARVLAPSGEARDGARGGVASAAGLGALLAAAALVRPEAGLLGLAVLVATARGAARRARSHGKGGDAPRALAACAAGFLVPLLVWLAYALEVLGSAQPTTSAAKSSGLVLVPAQIASDLAREGRVLVATQVPALLALVAAAAVPRARAALAPVLRRTLGLALVWAVLVLGGYALLGYEIVSRYLVPLLPIVAIAGTCAAWAVGRAVRRPGTVLAAFALLTVAQNAAVTLRVTRPQVESFSRGLERSLVPAAVWLRTHAAPADVVALPDIGAVGYYGERPVLDLGGLVTPAMTALRRDMSDEEILARGAYFSVGEPRWLLARGAGSDTLDRAVVRGHRLTRVFSVEMPNLGVTRPGAVHYTLYRIDHADDGTIAEAAPGRLAACRRRVL